MARRLHQIGLFAAHPHGRWVVLGAWLLVLALLLISFRTFGSNTSNNLELPGTDSQAATELLAERFPPQQNGTNPIVFHTAQGKVTDSANRGAIKASRAAILQIPEVDRATSPFSQKGQAQLSKDKRTAFLPVLLDVSNEDLTEELAQSVLDAAHPGVRAGMQVAAGGSIGSELSEPETKSSEVIGLAAAMVILAFTFGTLVAMGMPIVSAVLALLAGLSLIGLLGHVVQVPTIGPTLATMIGLGVGIDYALFLVTRYRHERAEGAEIPAAIATAVSTSGTAIVFAGSTVVIALVTLLIAGIPLVTTLGYSSAFAVITAVLGAITLLPALLAVLGQGIDRLPLPRFLHPPPKPPDRGFWGAWARFVTTRPWRCVAISMLVLLPLIVPMLSLDLGQEDVGATPKDTTERQAYDLIAAGFGVGYNGPLLVAIELGTPAKPGKQFLQDKQRAESLQSKLEQEQQQGEAEGARLSSQADALEAQQAALEGEQAVLEGEAAALQEQRSQLELSRAELARQRTLRAQLSSLAAKAREVARRGAELAARERATEAELEAVTERRRRTRAQLAEATDPRRRERLERRLEQLGQRQEELRAELARIRASRDQVEVEAQALARRAERLRDQAEALGADAIALGAAAEATALQAVSLEQQKDELQQAAADAEVQAANLNTQKAELQTTQQQAKGQQKEAEQLQAELTRELTNAGGDERGTDPRLVSVQKAIRNTTGVQVVSPPEINKAGDAAIFNAIPKTAPAATATADLVTTFREYVLPQSTAGTDLEAHVGGQTASYVDLAAGISAKLALVIAAVVGLGFVVLMTAFRSVLVPAQAAIANVLSVSAAFGVLTLCFQEGWGTELVGLDTPSGDVPIASFVPLIMFAVLFGLSMDYQVFLISQIEQHRAREPDDAAAIAAGLASGARVITAAALIMIAVFASFILNGDPTVKQFGVGLSVGVALAAISVMLLAPALLVLAGRGAWWVPAWADRYLPQIDIEGERAGSPGRG